MKKMGAISEKVMAGELDEESDYHLFWRVHLAGWLFISLFGLTSRFFAFHDAAFAVVLTVVLDPVGFVLTALAHFLFLSRARSLATPSVAGAVLAFSVVGGLLLMLIANLVREAFFASVSSPSVVADPVIPAVYYTSVLLGWFLAYFWLRADIEARSERARRSEAQARAMRAELAQLRLQLAPHFLFNALNTVTAEIHERPDTAVEMVRRIASYLRYSLDQRARPVCPLDDEIEAVRAYLRIQELRFEDRLECVVRVAPQVQQVAVPHMILQGLVENAIKYGLKTKVGRLEVRVCAFDAGDGWTVIEVSNPGELRPRDARRSPVGHANLRRRLELHYPHGHAVSLKQVGDSVVARLELKGAACFV